MSNHTLYLCYFSLREPLVQTQVLPYLREIKKLSGLRVSLMTFEPDFKKKWDKSQIAAEREKLAVEGIHWHVLPYHKSPSVPATLYDIFSGAKLTRKLVKREKINVLHARVHVPALMGAIVKKLTGGKIKLIFDIRGFMPEEYTDIGHWKADGKLYKSVKAIERRLLDYSDAFVVLTDKARDILFPESKTTNLDRKNRPVETIPCCVDFKRFPKITAEMRIAAKRDLNLENRRVITYVGSLGTWYLEEEMFDLIQTAYRQNNQTFALILTKEPSDAIKNKLLRRGLSESDFLVTRVSPNEISHYLSATDIALSFIKACYSKLSSSPTKVAEYLACGIPIICNRGVGDVDDLIETDKVGVLTDNLDFESYTKALNQIEQLRQTTDISEICRQSAENRFDLIKIGGVRYRSLYKRLLNLDDRG